MGNFLAGPTLVKVTRLKKGPGDVAPLEHYVGHLVDEFGNDMETPEIGTPICLTGDDAGEEQPYLFRSDPVWRLHVYADHWVALTELGVQYEIRTERQLQ